MSEKAYVTGADFPALAEGKLRLYSMRLCPFAQRARLVLAHKEIPYEAININLKAKPKWFLDRNPNGQVPVLEKDGCVVYESLVVADYLDTVYPDRRLVPADPYRKARDAMLIDYYGNKYISSYYKIVFSEGKDTDAAEVLKQALQKLEDELTNRKSAFFGGEKPAFVDYMLWPWMERFPTVTRVNADVTLTSYPHVQQWCQSMLTLPAVQKILTDADIHAKFYQLYKANDLSACDLGLAA